MPVDFEAPKPHRLTFDQLEEYQGIKCLVAREVRPCELWHSTATEGDSHNTFKMAEETAKSTGDVESVTLKIEGLWKAGDRSAEPYTEELRIKKDKIIADLWTDLQALGYEAPDDLKGKRKWYNADTVLERGPLPDIIEVIQDGQAEAGRSIHMHEPLIVFANRSLNQDLEVNVDETGETLSVEAAGCVLNMSLQRTTRMPDDEKLHQLPPSFGQFRLHNVSEYADRLPENITKAGGVFFPMWQREATWINFDVHSDTMSARSFALRVFVGQINAISGAKMKNSEEEKDKGLMDQTQDYAVVPGQEWLDGICVAPGVVRQFVAMPLGSGYTVEGQKTGEEKFGGLQIEVIPSYQQCLKRWTTEQANPKFDGDTVYLDEFKTPLELGLAPGDKLKAYQPKPPVSLCNMADLAEDISQNNQAMEAKYIRLARSGYLIGSSVPKNSCSGGGYKEVEVEVHARISTFPMEYGLSLEETVQPTDLHAMGLAAGGKLIQDIYEDDLPARIWNVNAARILHIHILDPRSFEAVTHIVPQPPPMDAKGTKGAIPYFVVEEQIDDRLDGGDFDNVASVSGMDKKTGIVTEPSLDPSKPTKCRECEARLCDCVVRPCGHLFCNSCIKVLEKNAQDENGSRDWKCPTCQVGVSHVAGFAAPMNLPGEETVRERVPVRVLKIDDGRVQFKSIQRVRV